jgi:SAM-dependent methyltransferase
VIKAILLPRFSVIETVNNQVAAVAGSGAPVSGLEDILICPRCGAALAGLSSDCPACTNRHCPYAASGFPAVQGQPELIDFEQSVFNRGASEDNATSINRQSPRSAIIRALGSEKIRRIVVGTNPIVQRNAERFLHGLRQASSCARVLVIGGGQRGVGAESLYSATDIDLIGTDVYATPDTRLIVDAHKLPFRTGSIDGVWIQAVIEHVLEPHVVVEEIHRVLRPGGLVYADTPFMQQVHGGAYDFTRFTLSGHRWLFRRFEQIDAGVSVGAGVATAWSIRYFFRSFGLSAIGGCAALGLIWLRFFNGRGKRGPAADGASGIYFLGVKSEKPPLTPKDMPAYYASQRD